MKRSELVVYGITISGKHPDCVQRRYYGVAFEIDDAICLVKEKAKTDGFTEMKFEDISRLGDLSFSTWQSGNDDYNLTEVPKCQS